MNKAKVLIALLTCCVGVVLLTSTQVQAQGGSYPFFMRLYATDGTVTDTIYLGVHASATNDIDSLISLTFGSTTLHEKELPPKVLANGPMDARSTTLNGVDTCGQGLWVNIHRYVSNYYTYIWQVEFQSDSEGHAFDFSWDAGLSSVGPGWWGIFDPSTDPPTLLADMTAGTSYHYYSYSYSEYKKIWIVAGDGYMYRTVTYDSLARATDRSNKPKPEKRKNYYSEATFTLNPADADSASNLGVYLEFSAGVVTLDASIAGTPDPPLTPDGKVKKVVYLAPILKADPPFTVHITGGKGKPYTLKKYWFVPAGTADPMKYKDKTPPTPPAPDLTKEWLHMPNWVNVLEETFPGKTWSGYFLAPNGLTVGLTSGVRYVYHPKYGDVLKTLFDKNTGLHNDSPHPLRTYKGKDITKALKTYVKKNEENELIAQAVTFKFNLGASANHNTPDGLGSVILVGSEVNGIDVSSLTGMNLTAIGGELDKYLSLQTAALEDSTAWLGFLQWINGAFAGPFDTTQFGLGTKVTGAKAIGMYFGILDRPGGVAQPQTMPPFVNPQPVEFSLEQNYPNPFNPTTTIEFNLSDDALVTLKVYNSLGQEVATLADHEEFYEGNNSIDFDASHLASGVYYYRIVVNNGELAQVKKMMLIK